MATAACVTIRAHPQVGRRGKASRYTMACPHPRRSLVGRMLKPTCTVCMSHAAAGKVQRCTAAAKGRNVLSPTSPQYNSSTTAARQRLSRTPCTPPPVWSRRHPSILPDTGGWPTATCGTCRLAACAETSHTLANPGAANNAKLCRPRRPLHIYNGPRRQRARYAHHHHHRHSDHCARVVLRALRCPARLPANTSRAALLRPPCPPPPLLHSIMASS